MVVFLAFRYAALALGVVALLTSLVTLDYIVVIFKWSHHKA